MSHLKTVATVNALTFVYFGREICPEGKIPPGYRLPRRAELPEAGGEDYSRLVAGITWGITTDWPSAWTADEGLLLSDPGQKFYEGARPDGWGINYIREEGNLLLILDGGICFTREGVVFPERGFPEPLGVSESDIASLKEGGFCIQNGKIWRKGYGPGRKNFTFREGMWRETPL